MLEIYSQSGYSTRKRQGAMSLSELLAAAEYVVDGSGNKKAVLLSLEVWRQLLRELATLEDAADAEVVRDIEARLAAGEEQLTDHADVWAELEALEAAGALPD